MTPRQITKIAGGGLAAVIALFVLFSSFYTVNQTERAVVLTNGAVSRVDGPGLHFKFPIVQSAVTVDLTQQVFDAGTMEGYSNDKQPANFEISVNYHVDPTRVDELYGNYQSIENFEGKRLSQAIPDLFKKTFSNYTSTTAIKERTKLGLDAVTSIKQALSGEPVVIESLNIKDIKFSDSYIQAIQAQQNAEVGVLTRRQELEQKKVEAQITVTGAQAMADSGFVVAQANARATQVQGDAEASAIRAKGDAEAAVIAAKGRALQDNPSIIQFTTADRWNGTLPTTMIPGGAVPLVNLK